MLGGEGFEPPDLLAVLRTLQYVYLPQVINLKCLLAYASTSHRSTGALPLS